MMMGELRCIHKNHTVIKKQLIDYYNADVIIVCQNTFHDDKKRIDYFKENTVYCQIYDKPDPLIYFDNDCCLKNVSNVGGEWNTFGCLQIYINMMEMHKVISTYNWDYDYYLMFRTDSNILFDLPDISIFNNLPHSVYGFYTDYWKEWGNLGGHYIHKKYINKYLSAPYQYIKNIKHVDILNEKQVFTKLNTLYYKNIDIDYDFFPEIIYQEILFVLAFESVDIHIKKIHNLPFYYCEDINETYTINNDHERITNNGICYKYSCQYEECQKNFLLWSDGYRWITNNNEILLSK